MTKVTITQRVVGGIVTYRWPSTEYGERRFDVVMSDPPSGGLGPERKSLVMSVAIVLPTTWLGTVQAITEYHERAYSNLDD